MLVQSSVAQSTFVFPVLYQRKKRQKVIWCPYKSELSGRSPFCGHCRIFGINGHAMFLLPIVITLSLPRVINVKFLLQPHQKYYITQYGELDFS